MDSRLGRFGVGKPVVSGEIADILVGRDEGPDGGERHVALKRFRPELAMDPRFVRLLLGEARVAAGLLHKHIIEVYEIIEAAGEYAIAMEYVHGVDVRTILAAATRRRTHVPLDYAIAIVTAVASALHHAHERRGEGARSLGIVHRNVSPSNILVGYDGSIKLTDFGTPMASRQRGADAPALAGRVSYLSPEQLQRGAVDRRSDVYSLGVVLYELVTTTRRFPGDDETVIDQIIHGDAPRPEAVRPELPAELVAIVVRALARDPEQRYASVNDLRIVLDQFASRSKRAPAAAVAAYLRKQFREPPVPWLDDAPTTPVEGWSGNSWIEVGRGDRAMRTGSVVMPVVSHAMLSTSSEVTSETSQGASFALERDTPIAGPAQPVARAAGGLRSTRLAMIGAPLVLIAGVAIWRLARTEPPPAATAQDRVAVLAPPPAPPAPAASSAVAPSGQPSPATPPTAIAPTKHTARAATSARSSTPPAASEPVAAVVAGPEPEPPPAPVVRPAEPAPPSVPVVAAPPPPVVPVLIPAQDLEVNRIAGSKTITPDDSTQLQIKQAGKAKLSAAYKLCITAGGEVGTMALLKSTGFAAFDAKIAYTIRDKWRYRPFLVNGRPTPVCSNFAFVYWPRMM